MAFAESHSLPPSKEKMLQTNNWLTHYVSEKILLIAIEVVGTTRQRFSRTVLFSYYLVRLSHYVFFFIIWKLWSPMNLVLIIVNSVCFKEKWAQGALSRVMAAEARPPLLAAHPRMRTHSRVASSLPLRVLCPVFLDSREAVLNKTKCQLFQNLIFGRRKRWRKKAIYKQ